MKQSIHKLIYWTPRLLSILFVVFLALFSLDVFESSHGVWDTMIGLLMHNIPTMMMLGVVILAWRYELVGAIGYVLGGITYIILVLQNPFEFYYLAWMIQISGVAFVIAGLFFVGWRQKRKPQ